ncbi:trimeric intracellular cation channel family protein [Haliscomenobacter sp.]|uniref:trimeric intracellular cation channel family protein n=1 Tax=Haliscomenobacter sp. TaxID=2717303 RepID=UPI003364F1FD
MDFIYVFELLGTFVFAISGMASAAEKKFDLFGGAVIGWATAVGGGTIRDLLIGRLPVSWMRDTNFLFAILAAIPVVYFFRKTILRFPRTFLWFDSLGIGLFTVLGLEKTLALGLDPAIAVVMGAVSATFGGVLRDLLCNEVPQVFRRETELYATVCLLGGLLYVLLGTIQLDFRWKMSITIVVVFSIRQLSVRYGWRLPAIK